MSFKRTVENFICERCAARVEGNGYTNHCPRCLWSKHVDIDPGDRANSCRGLMAPLGLEGSTPNYRIVHRCLSCGALRRVVVSRGDNTEALLALPSKGGIMEREEKTASADHA